MHHVVCVHWRPQAHFFTWFWSIPLLHNSGIVLAKSSQNFCQRQYWKNILLRNDISLLQLSTIQKCIVLAGLTAAKNGCKPPHISSFKQWCCKQLLMLFTLHYQQSILMGLKWQAVKNPLNTPFLFFWGAGGMLLLHSVCVFLVVSCFFSPVINTLIY